MSSSPLTSLLTGPAATAAISTGTPTDGKTASGEFATVLAAVEATVSPTAPAGSVEGELALPVIITPQTQETLANIETMTPELSEEDAQPANIVTVPAKITESLKTLEESITTHTEIGDEKVTFTIQPTQRGENVSSTEDSTNDISEDKISENLTAISPQISPEKQNSTKATFLTKNDPSDVSSSLEPSIYAGSAEDTKIGQNTSKVTTSSKEEIPTLDITVKNLNTSSDDPNLVATTISSETVTTIKTETKKETISSPALEPVTQYGFAPIATEQETTGQSNSNSSSQRSNQTVQATQATPTEVTSSPANPVTTPQTTPNTSVNLPQTVQAPRDTPLVQQIGKPVLELAKAPQGDHTLIIKINPDNLGQVTVQASISENNVRIELIASNDAGRDALKNMMSDLRKDLAQTGLNTSLNLSDQRSQERNQAATDFMNQKENSRNSSDMETRDEHSAKPLAEARTSREYRSSLNSDTLLDVLA